MYKKGSESGQILLIVVIAMIVALTVGLSIASRTITEVRLSRQNQESQRAFNAAEAGIDRVLQEEGAVSDLNNIELGNNASFDVVSEEYSGAQILLNNGEQVDQGAGADVWLSDYPDYSDPVSANLTIYWGEENQTNCSTGSDVRPALEVVLLQGSVDNPTIQKYLYDSCSSARIEGTLDSSENEFDNGGSPYTVSNVDFMNKTSSSISITDGIIMKIIPLFNSTQVAVVSDTALPSQGSIIESTGESGETIRKIIYYQSYPQMPLEVFPYSIISQ